MGAVLSADEEAHERECDALARELQEISVRAFHHVGVEPVEAGPAFQYDEFSFRGGEPDRVEVGFDIGGRVSFEGAKVFDHQAIEAFPIEEFAKIGRAESIRQNEAIRAELTLGECEHFAETLYDSMGFGVADLACEAGRKGLRQSVREQAIERGRPVCVGNDFGPPFAKLRVRGIGAGRARGVIDDFARSGTERPFGTVSFEGFVARPIDESIEVEKDFDSRIALLKTAGGGRNAGLGAAVRSNAMTFFQRDEPAMASKKIDFRVGQVVSPLGEVNVQRYTVPTKTMAVCWRCGRTGIRLHRAQRYRNNEPGQRSK